MAIHRLLLPLVASFQCSRATYVATASATAAVARTAGSLSYKQGLDSMEALENSMTVETALEVLHLKGRHELDHLLQDSASHGRRGELRGTVASLTPNTATPAPGSGVMMATEMLNGMIAESERKLDLEETRCAEFEQTQLILMEQIRQDIAAYNAVANEARAEILSAQTQIDMMLQKIPELRDSYDTLTQKCHIGTTNLRAQLSVLGNDITVMNRVVAMTSCARSASLVQLRMIRCKAQHAGGKANITFTHHALSKAIAGLKSDVATQGLQRRLAQIFEETKQAPTALVQRSAYEFDPPPAPTSAEPPHDKAVKKCTVASSPQCHKMLDRFLGIQTDIVDKRDALLEELKQLEQQCEANKRNLEAQISAFETRLKDQQMELALATKKQNDCEEQSRLKHFELHTSTTEYESTMKECKANIGQLHAEICGARKIRKEIYKMSDFTQLVQDCEVSDWVPQECTVTCGGGNQVLNRSMSIQPAFGGAGCPPLSMTRECNDFPCPIDCDVGDWSGYSSCSADCGGGLRQRVRIVRREAQHGGERCGETSETIPCAIDSCDRDCTLADWTEYGACSKECDGGLQERVRHVSSPQRGQGTCVDENAPERVEYKECNTQPCIPFGASPNTPLLCGSTGHPVKQDIVILLDGSGSLGEAGWEAVKAAGAALANSFYKDEEAGAEVAVVLFGGPRYWSDYDACTGHLSAGETPPDITTVCGLTWVNHFSSDSAAITAAIEGLTWPRSTTFTSGALALASNELSNGRPNAQSIVFVITDGRPLRRVNTRAQSEVLREKARLIWVPVTRFAPIEDVREWASRPSRNNVLQVDDFATLAEQSTVNDLVASSCPDVHT